MPFCLPKSVTASIVTTSYLHEVTEPNFNVMLDTAVLPALAVGREPIHHYVYTAFLGVVQIPLRTTLVKLPL